MIEKKLPSGATLKIGLPPFAEARELFQAVMEELKSLKIDALTNIDVNFFKDIFCVGFSSKRIEVSLNKCLRRCTYNDLKIDESTFEPIESREDYLIVLFEVIQETISPFTKNLTALLSQAVAKVTSIQ